HVRGIGQEVRRVSDNRRRDAFIEHAAARPEDGLAIELIRETESWSKLNTTVIDESAWSPVFTRMDDTVGRIATAGHDRADQHCRCRGAVSRVACDPHSVDQG